MSVSCEIKVFNPCGEPFKPGNIVAGEIKYTIHRQEVFNNVTIYLRGEGYLDAYCKLKRINREYYVNKFHVLRNDPGGFKLPIGTHTDQFLFHLPKLVPPSLEYRNIDSNRYYVKHVDIYYYIYIVFKRPGLFSSSKKFKKIISVGPHITPRLPTEPKNYLAKKFLTQFFTMKTSVVYIKATIENSIITPGNKIRFKYEVYNDTNLRVDWIVTKLMEVYIFHPLGGPKAKYQNCVTNTSTITGYLERGRSRTKTVEIMVPSNRYSIEGSGLIERRYYVEINAQLPLPHRDVKLKIPVQVGDYDIMGRTVSTQILVDIDEEVEHCTERTSVPPYRLAVLDLEDYEDPPPSYWEAMGEDRTSNDWLMN